MIFLVFASIQQHMALDFWVYVIFVAWQKKYHERLETSKHSHERNVAYLQASLQSWNAYDFVLVFRLMLQEGHVGVPPPPPRVYLRSCGVIFGETTDMSKKSLSMIDESSPCRFLQNFYGWFIHLKWIPLCGIVKFRVYTIHIDQTIQVLTTPTTRPGF